MPVLRSIARVLVTVAVLVAALRGNVYRNVIARFDGVANALR